MFPWGTMVVPMGHKSGRAGGGVLWMGSTWGDVKEKFWEG